MKQRITCKTRPDLLKRESPLDKEAPAWSVVGHVMRRGIVAFSVMTMQSCAMRPVPVRDVSIIETQPGVTAPQSAAGKTRRRSPDEFERHTFPASDQESVIGTLLSMPMSPGETLSDVARHFGLGYEEMAQANPTIDPWVPAANSEALIPQLFVLPRATRRGIVINLAAMRLFRFKAEGEGLQVTTYPVGIGREGKSTPTGTMAIARKTKHPAWYPTKNILADHAKRGDPLPAMVPAGPDNPLGDYAMYLSRPSYLIHGTNKPFSVGLRASNGCIRLYPENIEPLFGAAGLREPVQIVNQPYLYGWRGGLLYLQAYPPHEELNPGTLRAAIEADLKGVQEKKNHPLDWEKIAQVLRESRGVPIPVSQGTLTVEAFLASAVPVSHPRTLFGKPEPPAEDIQGWHVFATDTASEITARRVSAVLNHQGPPIPAKAVEVGERYQVIAGPFADAKAAKLAAHRIRADLELDSRILAPDETVAGTALSGAAPPAAPDNPRPPTVPEDTGVAEGAASTVIEQQRVSIPPLDERPTEAPPGGADRSLSGSDSSEQRVPDAAAEPAYQAIDHPGVKDVGPAMTEPAEPVWTEVAPTPEPPAAPAESSATSYPERSDEQPAPPDPYDASAWPEPATEDTPVVPAEGNERDDEEKSMELLPLEYPPQMYLPDNSADPIRFIEPGRP